MLVLDFKVNSRLKKEFSVESMKHPYVKNDTLRYNRGSHAILATSTKLLDIK